MNKIDLISRLETIVEEFERKMIRNKYDFFNKVLDDLIFLIPEAEKGTVLEYRGNEKVCIAQKNYTPELIERLRFKQEDDKFWRDFYAVERKQIFEEFTYNLEDEIKDEELKAIFRKINLFGRFKTLRGYFTFSNNRLYEINLDRFSTKKYSDISKAIFRLYLHISKTYLHFIDMQNEIEHKKEEIESLIENAPLSIVKFNKKGEIEYYNSHFIKTFGNIKNVFELKDKISFNSKIFNLEEIIDEISFRRKKQLILNYMNNEQKKMFGTLIIALNNEPKFLGILYDLGNYARRRELMLISLLNLAEIIGRITESYDESTHYHARRLSEFSELTTKLLKKEYKDKEYDVLYVDEYIYSLKIGAMLHDVGKFKIPQSILFKPAKLSDEEYNIIKKHPIYGEKILEPLFESVGNFKIENENNKVDMIEIIKNVVLYHHERFDGKGYPKGLKGYEIPLEARIIKLVDVYDALTHSRAYKRPFSHEEALTIIEDDASAYDPKILNVFLKYNEMYKEINDSFKTR